MTEIPFDWLPAMSAEVREPFTFNDPASVEQIATLENALGVSLPPSYRAFLLRWDGALIDQFKIFSCDEIMEQVELECGFEPYDGTLRFTADSGKKHRHIFGLKPVHFLPFAAMTFSADLSCFDYSRIVDDEPVVAEFPHDDDDVDRILRPDASTSWRTWQRKSTT